MIAIGLEGSANKLGVGVISHPEGKRAIVLSNIRHTFVSKYKLNLNYHRKTNTMAEGLPSWRRLLT